MKMTPIHNPAGQLLGHVDMHACLDGRENVILENRDFLAVPDFSKSMKDTIEACHVPKRIMKFYNRGKVVYHTYLVAEELPDWFWDTAATVKFSPKHWERGYPCL